MVQPASKRLATEAYVASALAGAGGGSGAGSGNVVRLVYTTAWPTRPVTGYVEWVDPTGTAPAPTAFRAGDTLVRAVQTGPTGPTQLLTAPQMGLTTTDWFVNAGTPTVNTTAGTITLRAEADKAALSNIPVAVGAQLVLSATLTTGALATMTVDVDFWTAANGYLESKWGASPLTTIVPANAHHASIILQGAAGATHVVDTVSLTQQV